MFDPLCGNGPSSLGLATENDVVAWPQAAVAVTWYEPGEDAGVVIEATPSSDKVAVTVVTSPVTVFVIVKVTRVFGQSSNPAAVNMMVAPGAYDEALVATETPPGGYANAVLAVSVMANTRLQKSSALFTRFMVLL